MGKIKMYVVIKITEDSLLLILGEHCDTNGLRKIRWLEWYLNYNQQQDKK